MEPRTDAFVHGATPEIVDRRRIAGAVYRLTRRLDNTMLRVLDAGVIVGGWLLAYLAGFEGELPGDLAGGPAVFLGLPLVAQLVANQLFGLYGPVWRYASVDEAARVIGAVGFGALVSTVGLAATAEVTDTTLPVFTTPPVAALLILLGCGGIRFQARLFALERLQVSGRDSDAVRTLIVGAGNAGAALAHELRVDAHGKLHIVGFVDDDPALQGRSVRRVRVLGTTHDLEELCRKHAIERILIAMPEARREEVQAIVARALQTDAQVKVLPRAAEVFDGPLLRSLRDLDLADLLGREPAPVEPREIADYLQGATVLVTGAGGSIGSEIARQVAQFSPARLLLLDRDESLLHEASLGEVQCAEPVLADIRDRARIREVFDRYRPDVVFHAAAHKHVPILERHPVEAMQTNLLGTWWLARAAAEYGCRRFVLISTDKAANPCSVMGATKRAAELAVFEVGSRHQLPFAAVRFGNVLGSRGSVVPTFLRQILDGGPVTVTDPDMTRYFMTIPEAVSLVLQAGAMAHDGRVFVLDMGSPVSIMDLARQMIRLAGLRPDDDVKIEIVGTRPGERLHERLHDDFESVQPSRHPSIREVTPHTPPDSSTLVFFLELLEMKCSEVGAAPTALSILEQMLRHCAIDCQLRQSDSPAQPVAQPIRGRAKEIVLETTVDDAIRPALPSPARNGSSRPLRPPVPAVVSGDAAFVAGLPFVRPARPHLDRVLRRLAPSYEDGVLTNGPLVKELEERVAERIGASHVVAVSSCTSGLMLAVQALTDGRPGGIVLPSFTFSASAHAIMWNGRRPHFVECDPSSWQIDVDHARERLHGAAALMATHVFGAPCTPEAVAELGRAHALPVIFDAAHAFGARANGRPLGTFGNVEVFSLTPTKVLVAGEGGLVATADAGLAEQIRIGRDYGNPGDYDTQFPGLNARMSEFHAAMALESLERLDEVLARRSALATRYRELLEQLPGVVTQRVPDTDASTYKDFTVLIDPKEFGLTRDELAAVLAADGVDTRQYFYPPVHQQRTYRDLNDHDLPITDAVASRVISLPIFPDLRDEDVELVADVISGAHAHSARIRSCLHEKRLVAEHVPTLAADS